MSVSRRTFVATTALALTACAAKLERSAEPNREAGMAPVNGTNLYFETSGSGHPVIFIHGLTLDSRMWADQEAEFAKHHRVIRYDARGFGRSGPVTGPFSPIDDLSALMDHLGVQRAHMVGLSMGGRYAIEFALTRPDRVRGLVAVDAVLPGIPTPNFGREVGAVLAAGRGGNLVEAKRLWLASSLFTAANEQPSVAARLRQMVDDYSGWHFANGPGMHEKGMQPLAAQRLGELRVPTLVVVGSREIPELFAASEKIARDVPGSTLAVVNGAGHMSNMESPALFNRIVLEWLAAIR